MSSVHIEGTHDSRSHVRCKTNSTTDYALTGLNSEDYIYFTHKESDSNRNELVSFFKLYYEK